MLQSWSCPPSDPDCSRCEFVSFGEGLQVTRRRSGTGRPSVAGTGGSGGPARTSEKWRVASDEWRVLVRRESPDFVRRGSPDPRRTKATVLSPLATPSSSARTHCVLSLTSLSSPPSITTVYRHGFSALKFIGEAGARWGWIGPGLWVNCGQAATGSSR